MGDLGKLIIFVGIVLVVFGLVITFASKIPFIGKLPGDILIKKDGFIFYFPIATSIILSILITIVINFFTKK